MSDLNLPLMAETDSGLSVPASAVPATPQPEMAPQMSRQQRRKAERELEARRSTYRSLANQGFPVPRQGDMRVTRCAAEAHPFHVASFCVNHVAWEMMPDEHPMAASLIEEAILAAERVKDERADNDDYAEEE